MTGANRNNIEFSSLNRFGFYIAILTSAITLATFFIAFFTPPISGPFCTGGCISYPYKNITDRFPADYYWMFPAILMMLVFVILMVCMHYTASGEKKIFSLTGLLFAMMSAMIIIVDYYIQLSVIQPSLLKGETDGIAILTQYNPHGIFIALEEAGYLLMSAAFLFMGLAIGKTSRLERSIRIVLIFSFSFTILAFGLFLIKYGVKREYLFEITIITINYFTLITAGILLSILFRKAEQKTIV